MNITVQAFQPDKVAAEATAVFMFQGSSLKEQIGRIQTAWNKSAVALAARDFAGARDSAAIVYTGDEKMPRLILIGLGERGDLSNERIRRATALAAQQAGGVKATSLAILLPEGESDPAGVAQAAIEGVILGSYSFDKYFTEKKEKNGLRKPITKIVLLCEEKEQVATVKKGATAGRMVADAVTFARDLVNAPSNEIYPETLVSRTREKLTPLGVKVTAFNKKKIEQLKMGGLLAVNQGSVAPAYFMIMEWNGGRSGAKPIVLVGKGLTFDSGGISIKPAAGMADMKMDMGGAGAVIGAMHAVAELKLPHNVIGLVPTTDNMPSGSAFKPGDVITFLNGKTAEIDNTDAEGRLVLADALSYADRYQPQAVIDLATLTGACVVALGNVASGLLGNNRTLNRRIVEAGERSYDRVVELPLHEEYEELIRSDIADVKNSGGRAAGTITAALFLQHFIGDYPWAHIDIAGTAMIPKPSGYLNKGGTGAGVRILVDLIQNWDGPLDS
jgi:leucyl aminopeptidase